jgi:hypothetical protein
VSILFAVGLASSVPLIDVHRHAGWPDSDGDAVQRGQLEELEANGVKVAVVAVTNKADVERWQREVIIVGTWIVCPRNQAEPRYHCFPDNEGWADPIWLEEELAAGRIQAIHELTPSYSGISPANPRLEQFWALADAYDIPVGVHTQRGPPPGARNSIRSNPDCCPNYDPEMGNPALLRPILTRYPDLRIWLQHIGAGRGDHQAFWPETLALLNDYPNVYVDLSITNGAMPIEEYGATLRRLIDAGFGDRIMFGSDNLPIGPILQRLEGFAWLDEDQKQAILHGNATRFFRLTD